MTLAATAVTCASCASPTLPSGASTSTELEDATRRYGRRCLTAGISILVAGYLAALSGAVFRDVQVFESKVAQLFGFLTFNALVCLGGILTTLGAIERLQRPQRALQRQLMSLGRRNNDILQTVPQTNEEVRSRLDLVESAVAGLEEAVRGVPSYGQGVMDGVAMRRQVVGDTD